MDSRLLLRLASRPADDERPLSREEVAGLRTLSQSALRLRAALRRSDVASLRESVAAYVACATAAGISLRRICDAIELFVSERATTRRHIPTDDLLDFVLRLASEAGSAPRQLREAL